MVDLPKINATLWINEEGKVEWEGLGGDLTRDELQNDKAHYLSVYNAGGPVASVNFIAGDVAITGGVGRNGETLPLPEEALKAIRHAIHNISIFKIGARR